ncbi:MAG: dTDP-4-dehydrorhamnose 3,5-epimerase [Spirochaetae bacterium HGW-Spirochaetae-5]|nr:MAG: dTDP-4-dehydrorhamnose 3,5-epimerase [Spirochaetae bacterium HGW-Spirochaetae-5]
MQIIETIISGCYEILPGVFRDSRGEFIKTFNYDEFVKYNLVTDFKEEFYSVSHINVLRGLHFQSPPCDQEKIVTCMNGGAVDIILDIRKKSITYGKYLVLNISANKRNMVYIPKGCAHGFLSLADNTVMNYKVTSVHSPICDSGILWDSIGYNWPVDIPIISDRDKGFLPLNEFKTPF